MHHLSAYALSLGLVTDTDVTAPVDTVLQTRNSHLIMSEQFNLLALYGNATTLGRAKFANAALTQRGSNHLWPLMATATPPSRPYLMDLRSYPLVLPMNEEITIQATTTGAGPAVQTFGLFLAKPNWNPNTPTGLQSFITRSTITTVAATATTWTGDVPMTFERDLFNGVYAVVGATVTCTNGPFFRMLFKTQPIVEGRQLRPGGLCINAIGDLPWPPQLLGLGEWGRFHTFEPPSIQVFGDAVGATYEVRLAVVYLGQDKGLLFNQSA